MDVDAWVARNQDGWYRLQALTGRARRLSSLAPDELDELIHLYQRAGAHLADARVTYVADPQLVDRLTLLVADAHGVLYSRRETDVRTNAVRLMTETFPAAIVALRRFIMVAFLLMAIPWAVMTVWLARSPQAFDALGPEAASSQYIEQDFEAYYSNRPSQDFATQVFLNNIRVAFLVFAAGVLLCVVTAAILVYNGMSVGVAGGMFASVGQSDKFWGLILPHGLLELSAVVVAGAAGLRVGWSIINPGDRSRFASLTATARETATVVVGLVVAFLMAALVEGFVTGKPWPTAGRVGIGAVTFLAFWGTTIFFATSSSRVAAADSAQSRPTALSSR